MHPVQMTNYNNLNTRFITKATFSTNKLSSNTPFQLLSQTCSIQASILPRIQTGEETGRNAIGGQALI